MGQANSIRCSEWSIRTRVRHPKSFWYDAFGFIGLAPLRTLLLAVPLEKFSLWAGLTDNREQLYSGATHKLTTTITVIPKKNSPQQISPNCMNQLGRSSGGRSVRLT